MRSRKAIINTLMAILAEVVTVACGLIAPKLILDNFGSAYSGITTSIAQFLRVITLLNAGIAGVTKAALFKPLAQKDTLQISRILRATEIYMRRIALIFIPFLVGFGSVYPFFAKSEGDQQFGWFFTFTLVIIIGLSTFAEYFFGTTYQMLLGADQRQSVISAVNIGGIIANTALMVITVRLGCGIHVVKLVSAFVFIAKPLIFNFYVKRKYKLNMAVEPDNTAVRQRKYALGHTIANYVHDSTDIVVLTLFTSLQTVSIYTVYSLVATNLVTVIKTFSSGIDAAFGNMIAKDEKDVLRRNVRTFETFMYFISTVVFTTMALSIVSFISIYTRDAKDAATVNYIQPLFAYLLSAAQFFYCIRIPYLSVVQAAGHYKQTRNGAYVEAAVNLVISVILVWHFGVVGVAVGTLVAMIFRTVQYSLYVFRNIINVNPFGIISKLAIYLSAAAVSVLIYMLLPKPAPAGYIQWALSAIVIFAYVFAVTLVLTLVFYHKDVKYFFTVALRAVGLKKGK
ncbi:MAG: polysaccharide biosynthesis C-terminal domain-containing protein [Clostridia bacterium]|nr:polysaccharide biosynthesis C-terminal domain-containing protein [Clostridia bacterium]